MRTFGILLPVCIESIELFSPSPRKESAPSVLSLTKIFDEEAPVKLRTPPLIFKTPPKVTCSLPCLESKCSSWLPEEEAKTKLFATPRGSVKVVPNGEPDILIRPP